MKNILSDKDKRKKIFGFLIWFFTISFALWLIGYMFVTPLFYRVDTVTIINEQDMTVDTDIEDPITGNEGAYLLNMGDKLVQTFTYDTVSPLDGIRIKFLSNQNETEVKNTGKVRITVDNVTQKTQVLEEELNLSEVNWIYYRTFTFPELLKNAEGDQISVTLDVIKIDKDYPVYCEMSKDSEYKDGKLVVNGTESDLDICVSLQERRNTYVRPIFRFIVFITLIFISVLYYVMTVKKRPLYQSYIIIALYVGFVYCMLMPPYTVPDEPVHLEKSYSISNKILGIEDTGDEHTMYMRTSDTEAILTTNCNTDVYQYIYHNFWVKCENKTLIEGYNSNIDVPKFLYVPSAFGITIGRLLGLGTMLTYWLGRWMNYLLATGLIAFSLKRVPIGKATLLLIAMLPMTIQQTMSFSYDSMIIGISIALVCQCLYIAFGKGDIKVRDLVLYCIFAALLAMTKNGAYLPLCGIAIIIPFARFKDRKQYLKCIGIVAASIAVAFLIQNIGVFTGASQGANIQTGESNIIGWANEEGYTIPYILQNKKQFLKLVANTAVFMPDFYIQGLIGKILGWFNIQFSETIVYIMIILLTMSVFYQEEEGNVLKKGQKAWIFVLSMCCLGIIELGMLLNWTPISCTMVEGVQGRYFIPFFFPFLLIFRSRNIVIKKSITDKLVYVMILCQLVVFRSIVTCVI